MSGHNRTPEDASSAAERRAGRGAEDQGPWSSPEVQKQARSLLARLQAGDLSAYEPRLLSGSASASPGETDSADSLARQLELLRLELQRQAQPRQTGLVPLASTAPERLRPPASRSSGSELSPYLIGGLVFALATGSGAFYLAGPGSAPEAPMQQAEAGPSGNAMLVASADRLAAFPSGQEAVHTIPPQAGEETLKSAPLTPQALEAEAAPTEAPAEPTPSSPARDTLAMEQADNVPEAVKLVKNEPAPSAPAKASEAAQPIVKKPAAAEAAPATQPKPAGKTVTAEADEWYQLEPAPPEHEVRMLSRGEKLLQAGDIAAARQIFTYLAHRGSVAGARALAATFEPETFQILHVYGMEPDPESARKWRNRATELEDIQNKGSGQTRFADRIR